MSACWLDFDNDGNRTFNAAGMWVRRAWRVFGQSHFHGQEQEKISARSTTPRHMARQHPVPKSGQRPFQMWAMQAGLKWAVGRGPPMTGTLTTRLPGPVQANGYITGHDGRDASSFSGARWVSKSPQYATRRERYERGCNAITS